MPRKSDRSLPAAERKKLAELVKKIGQQAAAEKLGISRSTVGQALAGLALQRSTLRLLIINLAKENEK